MSNKARNTSGKFAAKSDVPRKVRSVNLTDTAWLWLARIAEEAGVSRNDYLEAMAEHDIQSQPLMETVETEEQWLERVSEGGVNDYNEQLTEQPNIELLPIMETVQTALTSEVDTLIILKNQEIAELKAQLAGKNQIISEADEQISKLEDEAAEYAETKKLYNEALSEEIRGRNSSEAHDLRQQQEISNLKSEIEDWKAKYLKASNAVRELNHGKFHQPTPIAVEFPESAIILSQLRAKRKKSKADLGDIEFVVEMLEVLKN